MSATEELARVNAAIDMAEQVKSLPTLKKEQAKLTAEIAAEHLSEAQRVEDAVREYEAARADYRDLQDALIAEMPEWIETLEAVYAARVRQDKAQRAAEKAGEYDLTEKVQTVASRAIRYDEPFRTIDRRWRSASRLDV